VLLSACFGTSDGFWIDLPLHFDLEMAKIRSTSKLPESNLSHMLRMAAWQSV